MELSFKLVAKPVKPEDEVVVKVVAEVTLGAAVSLEKVSADIYHNGSKIGEIEDLSPKLKPWTKKIVDAIRAAGFGA
jgi:hypothetical protein